MINRFDAFICRNFLHMVIHFLSFMLMFVFSGNDVGNRDFKNSGILQTCPGQQLIFQYLLHLYLMEINNKHTVAVLCQRHDFIILYNFFDFYVSRHHAYSRCNAN